jgi:DNA-binding beta-propeller fold protein YncE
LFRCPSCGASLEVVDAPSVTCKYCGSSVPVPADLRPHKPQVIIQAPTIDLSEPYAAAARSSRRASLVITLVILLFVGGISVFALLAAQRAVDSTMGQVSEVFGSLPGGELATAAPKPTPTPGFASRVLEFGGKGSGPGLFEDARYLAVDKDGNLYVAEFDAGVVQKFDRDGQFAWLVNVEPDDQGYTTIEGMAADFAGNLFVSRRGDILRFSAAGGSLIDTLPGQFAETWYTTLVADAGNTLYALHESAGQDDLLVLKDGQLQARWEKFVSSQNRDDPAISLDIAVDGRQNVYVSSSFGKTVYVFDRDGRFVDRFGQEGNEPGAMSSPGAIAVDGRSRIYVVDFGGVNVYDPGGDYLATIEPGAGVRDIAVDLEGNIYVLTINGTVEKHQPTPKG